jgi:indole-3-acetate monooxygenase
MQRLKNRSHKLRQSVEQLRSSLARLQHTFDIERELPTAVIHSMAERGLFNLWLPAAYSGAEIDPIAFADIIIALASIDGSIGWCASVAAMMSRLAGFLPESAARQIFGSGESLVAGALNPRGTALPIAKGYRISGHWRHVSFVKRSAWVGVACVVMRSDENGEASKAPELRLAFVQRDEVEIVDTWNSLGLRATGSHDVQVSGVLVPEERTIPFSALAKSARQPGALFSLPPLSPIGFAAVALGIARGAIDHVKADVAAGASSALYASRAYDLTQAETWYRSGRCLLDAALSSVWTTLCESQAVTRSESASLDLACWQATHFAKQAVDLVFSISGSHALIETNALGRRLRDIHAVAQHMAFSRRAFESAAMAWLSAA